MAKPKTPKTRARGGKVASTKGPIAQLVARERSERQPSDDLSRNGQQQVAAVDFTEKRMGEDGEPISETFVVNRVLDAWPLDRMFRNGTIDEPMYKAGEDFRNDFERAGLIERYATINPDKFGGAPFQDGFAGNLEARRRVRVALERVGEIAASILCDVVGNGHAITTWVARARWNGKSANEHFARGLLIAGLDSLAITYGYRKNVGAARKGDAFELQPVEREEIREARRNGATFFDLSKRFRVPMDQIADAVRDIDDERRRAVEAATIDAVRAKRAEGRSVAEISILFNLPADRVGAIIGES